MFLSAHEPSSLEALKQTLRARIQARLAHVRVELPVADGEVLATLYREGEVVDRADHDDTVVVTVRLPRAAVGRLRGRAGVLVQEVA